MKEISADRAREIAGLLPDFPTVYKYTPAEWAAGKQEEATISGPAKILILNTMDNSDFTFFLRDGNPNKELIIQYPPGDERRWVVPIENMPD